jgi:hypothetical protein
MLGAWDGLVGSKLGRAQAFEPSNFGGRPAEIPWAAACYEYNLDQTLARIGRERKNSPFRAAKPRAACDRPAKPPGREWRERYPWMSCSIGSTAPTPFANGIPGMTSTTTTARCMLRQHGGIEGECLLVLVLMVYQDAISMHTLHTEKTETPRFAPLPCREYGGARMLAGPGGHSTFPRRPFISLLSPIMLIKDDPHDGMNVLGLRSSRVRGNGSPGGRSSPGLEQGESLWSPNRKTTQLWHGGLVVVFVLLPASVTLVVVLPPTGLRASAILRTHCFFCFF